jgi:MOB kinase activator 1
LSEYAKATLGSGNMRSSVILPKGEDINEWLAVNSTSMLLSFVLLLIGKHCLAHFLIVSPLFASYCAFSIMFPAVDFFNEISLLYGTITEFCTPATCPVMSAGPQYEYLWADGVKVKKPIKVSAPEYVDLLMSWVETQLNDEHVFPLQLGMRTPFSLYVVLESLN